MAVSSRQRALLVDLMLTGHVTPSEVAAHVQLSLRAVHKWCPALLCADARQSHAGGIIALALEHRIDADGETRRMPRIVSQVNYKKRAAIAGVRSGKMSIPKAARFAGVPLAGMVGWLKLAGVHVPEEFDTPHRQPRSAEPLSRASVGNTK